MCEKTKKEKKKRNFGHSYLRNGLSDFLQIWNVDSPSWRETLQQIWFQSDEVSPRYKCVKMTFFFFLSIYSRCGAPASWAARHTIVCLDVKMFFENVCVRIRPYPPFPTTREPNYVNKFVCGNLCLRFAELPWVFGAFVEVNGSYFNTNGFNINTVILFMEGIRFAIFQCRPALVTTTKGCSL